ncbi:MAG: hypothetical protein OEV87_09550 [Phycisphaerae bacterium]|nr:hypothetical protein [Phycisphaerae bacterium]
MIFFAYAQIGLLAEGLFDLFGPILIFGIYIVASIVKTVAKKRPTEDSGEETESELKKAVRRRYQEIYQRQTGQTQPRPPEQRSPQYVQPRPVQQAPPIRQPQRSQWEIQQEAIRQRNAKLQSQRTVPKRPHVNAPTQTPKAVIQPNILGTQKQRVPKKTKTVEGSQKQSENLLAFMVKSPENLRSAIILKEILDKPLALRDV